jgi:hypothetical protein
VNETPMHAIRQVLEGTEEALVLGFHLNDEAAEFELVCEFWNKSAGADRAFVRFRFCGVEEFERRQGRYPQPPLVGTTFVARAVRAHWVIQQVRTGNAGTSSAVSFSFGLNFGDIEFRYESVTYDVVHLIGKPAGTDKWVYFEIGTGRLVDFYNPFGCAWAEETSR